MFWYLRESINCCLPVKCVVLKGSLLIYFLPPVGEWRHCMATLTWLLFVNFILRRDWSTCPLLFCVWSNHIELSLPGDILADCQANSLPSAVFFFSCSGGQFIVFLALGLRLWFGVCKPMLECFPWPWPVRRILIHCCLNTVRRVYRDRFLADRHSASSFLK